MAETPKAFTAYVTNVPYSSSPKDLYEALQKFGKIQTSRIISTTFRGQKVSRGFGFVDFDTQEGLDAAVAATRTVDIKGRKLIIKVAHPPNTRKRDTLFIRGIPAGIQNEQLLQVFAKWNPKEAKVVYNDNNGRLGFGFVQFNTEEDQTAAFQANRQITLGDSQSTVKYANYSLNQAPKPRRSRFPYRRRNFYRRAQRRPRPQQQQQQTTTTTTTTTTAPQADK